MGNFKLFALVLALLLAEGMASATALSAPLRAQRDEPFSMQCTPNPLTILHGRYGEVRLLKTEGNGNPIWFKIAGIASSSGRWDEVTTTPRKGEVAFASLLSPSRPSAATRFWVFSKLEDGPARDVDVTIQVLAGNDGSRTEVTCTVVVRHTDIESPPPPTPSPEDRTGGIEIEWDAPEDVPSSDKTPPVDIPVDAIVLYKEVEPSPDQDRTYECDPALLRMANGEKGVIYLRASDGVGRPAAWRAERFEPEGDAIGTLALVDYRTGKAKQIDMEHPGSQQEWLQFETGEYAARIDVLSSAVDGLDRTEEWELTVLVLEESPDVEEDGDLDPSAVEDRLPVRVREAKCRVEVQPAETASAPTSGGPGEGEGQPAATPEPTSTPVSARNSYTSSGRNDGFTTADRIELPATIRGRTSPTSAPSFFTFTAAGEGQRTVQANWNAPGGDNCTVSLFGGDGRFLQRGRGADGAFGVQVPAGQYYAAIQCSGAVREYELNLDMAGP